MTYTSVEQRIAYGYIAQLPDFIPDEHGPVTVSQQKEFYGLMKRLYQLAFDEPLLFVPTVHEDDAFPTRYKKSCEKPELNTNILKMKNAVEAILDSMFKMGQGADVKLNKRQTKILSLLGMDDLSDIPAAWTWMATRSGTTQVAFAYCLFDESHVYSIDIFARMLGEKPFRKLEKWMKSHGYKPYDIYNTTWVNYQLTLTYANPAWSDERPSLGNEYKIRHTGISAQYDAYVRNPAALGLCIPGGMKPYLENFALMERPLQDFILSRVKRCDGCSYCVQTDKSGKRSLAKIAVSYEGETYSLCPYYPGYSFCWTSIDDALVDHIIAMLDFMDGFVPNKK
ncbi:hypothetical protein [Eisenbergiella sp.]